MIANRCGSCRFWAKGVRWKKKLELCSEKGAYQEATDSCDKWKHLDSDVQSAIDGLLGPR